MKAHLDAILQALGGSRTSDHGIRVHCPAHKDRNPSLDIDVADDGKLLAICRSGCDQAAVIAALKARGLWPEPAPRQDSPDGIPGTWRGKPFTQKWPYRAEDNTVLGIVARYDGPDGKEIIPFFKRDGQRWASGAAPVPRPLYGLDELPGYDGDVVVVEGEKACDAAQKLVSDAVALTWPGGSNAVKKADWSPMRGKNVIVWPDADGPGLKAARDVAEACRTAGAATVRVLTPPSGKPKGWDAADAVTEGWTRETFAAWLEAPEQPSTKEPDPYLAGIFTGADLLGMVLPEIVWAVQSLLAMGLAILAGGPKLGKSWLVTLICLGVGRGGLVLGHFTAERGKVLCLSLEDSKRRLQDRIKALCQLEPELAEGLENVDFQTTWPRADEDGLEKLETYIRENVPHGLKLVVLDTLAKIGPKSKPKGLNAYEADSLAMGQIKAIADKYSICILVVTHMSKGRSSSNRDPFEAITGSSGQFGTADTAMLLTRTRGAETAKLITTGRDIDGESYGLRWTHPGWTCTGIDHGATAPKISPERQAILQAFATHDGPLSPNMVAHAINKSPKTTSKLINSLSEDGLLVCVGYGLYSLVGVQSGGSNGSDRSGGSGGSGGSGTSTGDVISGGSSNLCETRVEGVTSTTSTSSTSVLKEELI